MIACDVADNDKDECVKFADDVVKFNRSDDDLVEFSCKILFVFLLLY